MGDVHCCTCKEPWEVYHLQWDAIYETDLAGIDRKKWGGKLTSEVRAALADVGYHFGSAWYILKRCPCCTISSLDKERLAIKEMTHDLLGDDDDGAISLLEDGGYA